MFLNWNQPRPNIVSNCVFSEVKFIHHLAKSEPFLHVTMSSSVIVNQQTTELKASLEGIKKTKKATSAKLGNFQATKPQFWVLTIAL